jgi:hypothetical protein
VRPLSFALAATLASLTFALDPAPAPTLDFEALAKSSLKSFGHADASPTGLTVQGLVEEKFAWLRIGALRVYCPTPELEHTEHAKDFRRAAVSVCKAQRKWIEWLISKDRLKKAAPPLKEFETFEHWISQWSPQELEKVERGEARDLLAALGAPEEVVAASEKVATYCTAGHALGIDSAEGLPANLVLVPSRKSFVELVALIGWLRPELKEFFWVDGLPTWTEALVDDWRVICLKYAAFGGPVGEYEREMRMDEREPTGMEQFVAERSFFALLYQAFGDRVPPVFGSGLAMSLVIDLYGEDNTRSEGDLRGRSKPPREVFVPGGASQGGTLPPNNADSHWRDKKGSDHFIEQLKEAQQNGYTEVKDRKKKNHLFRILGDEETGTAVVESPFLGAVTKDKALPAERFLGDYLEFFRAYKVGFLHWLRTASDKDKKQNEKRFADLLCGVLTMAGPDDFDALAEKIYGVPLSSTDHEVDTLESRFLTWLAK